jgi:hypothetical protein
MGRTRTRTATLAAAASAAALAAAPGAAGTFPPDAENVARWAVLDGLPEQASGRAWPVEVRDLRTRDVAAGRGTTVSAVCGTLDFLNADDGAASFVVWFGTDDDGGTVMVGRPFLYGPLPDADPGHQPQHAAAQAVCGTTAPEAAPVVAAR